MIFGQNCEIWTKLSYLVKIVKFGRDYEILSKLVWPYILVEILKLHVGSGRLSVGSGRLCAGSGRFSGWVVLKSGGWVGKMDG